MHRNVLAYLFLAITILGTIGCTGNKQPDKPERKLSAVRPNYIQDIAPFIFENCATCHSHNSLAPFALTNYDEISGKAHQIGFVLDNKTMPPWKPDPTYSDLIGQPHIDTASIAMIKQWMKLGMPFGPVPKEPVYKEAEASPADTGAGQLVFKVADKFSHPGDGGDYFHTYLLPLNNKDTLFLNRIELQGQNKKIFHHAWLAVLNADVNPDSLSPEVFLSRKARALGGFLPNMTTDHLAEGYAKVIPPGTKFMLTVHYGHASTPQEDQPVIVLHPIEKKKYKSVEVFAVREDSLLEPEFKIPADSTKTFHLRHTLDENMEVLSVIPHMHFRGRTFKAFAVRKGTNDTLNLVRVNDWDFNWQNMYYLRTPIQLRKGDVIYVEGYYDNTAKNRYNPAIPPVEVVHGERSKDEMLELMMEVIIN